MSDHLIAEAHRHAMALPTTHPTHADIAWYVREVSGLRAELALLREWQREVIQNANAHHAERKDAIARAESAEREAFDWKKIARYEAARAERAEAELAFQVARNSDLFTQRDQIRAELDAERARLDAVVANYWSVHSEGGSSFSVFGNVCGDYIATAQTYRAAIDAAMKEETK
jgi:hypothetical protein